MDRHEHSRLVSCLEGRSETKGLALVSVRLHDFLVRTCVASSHDFFRDDAISGFHNECIYVALAWGALSLAKVGAFRILRTQFPAATSPRSMVSLTCDSPLYHRFWIVFTAQSAV